MKLQEALSEYQYRNVGQFRAIAESLGYNQEYNKGSLRFSRENEEIHIDMEKIRSYTKNEPDTNKLDSSMERMCSFFDKEKSSSPEYKSVLAKEGFDVINWGNLKEDEKDKFTIVDHKNKVTYTGRELYDYAFQNGYMLDGKGTKLEKGVMSELTDVNGKPAKIRLSENGISVFYKKESLVIPDSIFGKKLSQKQKDDLLNGNVIVLSSKKGDIMLQVDKELNSVIVRSEKELAIPARIGGYELTPADKYLLANGFSLENKLLSTPDGSYIIADISMTPDKKGYQFANIQSVSESKAIELLQKKLEEVNEKAASPEKEHAEVQEQQKDIPQRDMEKELKEAIEKNDYEKMAQLKEEGYKPSEEVIRGLGGDVKIDEKQAIVIEKLFGTKPEIQKEEETVYKKEDIKVENVNEEKKITSPELDKEFKDAVEKGDFVKLADLKEKGYRPSAELMQSISETTSSNTMIAVQKIYGIKSASNTLGNVKLAHGAQKTTENDLKRPIANTVNRMFSDL